MSFSLTDYSDIRFFKKGGQANLYRATHNTLKREVVLKKYHAKELQEARLNASLKHPGLVTVYDYGEENGESYLSMEYLCGCSLQEVFIVQPLSVECKVHVGLQFVEVLTFLHEQKIVHGDLSAGNIVLSYEGQLKVLDLGMSQHNGVESKPRKRMSATQAYDVSRTFVGTLKYMPPESFSGEPSGTMEGDFYSAALLLAELFMEKPVFGTLDKKQLLKEIQQSQFTLENSIPDPLREVLNEYLVREPKKRPTSFSPLKACLQSLRSAPIDSQTQKGLKIAALEIEKEHWGSHLEELEQSEKWEQAFSEVKIRMNKYPEETEWLNTLQRLGQKMNLEPAQGRERKEFFKLSKLVSKMGLASLLGIIVLVVFLVVWFFQNSEYPGNKQEKASSGSLIEATEQTIGKEWFSPEWETIRRDISKKKLAEEGKVKQGLWGTLVFPDFPKSYQVFLNGKFVQDENYVSTSRWVRWKQGAYLLQIKTIEGEDVYKDSLLLYSSEPVKVQW